MITNSASAKRSRIATMVLFFCSGLAFASWGVHIPTIKDRFGLSEGALSMAMLAAAVGAILAMPYVGRVSARLGSAKTSLLSGVLLALGLLLILVMPSFLSLLVCLLFFGAVMAGLDVAMNAQAALVETALGKPIMSSMHGLFSLGGLAGAALGGAWLALDGAPLHHLIAVAIFTALCCLLAWPYLLPDAPHVASDDTHSRQHLDAHLRLLGLLAFLGLVAEGAMYDWSTVYMRDYAHASTAWVSAGYATFSTGMALGRFGGDRVRAALGNIRVLRWSGTLCVMGIFLSILLPLPFVSALGFALVGFGTSNMMPVLFSAAAAVKGMPPAQAIAAMARVAYIGLLVGPVLIGAVAQHAGLRVALVTIALSAALVTARARKALSL